jgi:bifunctional non-homologous end joining protein LigD
VPPQRVPPRRPRHQAPDTTLPLFDEAPSGLPLPLRPEVSVPCSAAFDNQDWRFTVDWDGMRAMLVVGAGEESRLVDELGGDAGSSFPEILAAAAPLSGRTAVLDGVVAALDGDGRPDLAALCARLGPGLPSSAGQAAVYLATDLLHLDGAPLVAWPLDRRHQALAALLAPQARLQVPGWVSGHGRAFCEAAAERGLPAVLARLGDSPYHPAMASPERLRIALEERADAVVVGVVAAVPPSRQGRRPPIAALLLAEQVDGHLVDAGRVGAGLSQAMEGWLWSLADTLTVLRPAVSSDAGAGEPVLWLRPALVATVRHHGRDAAGRLRMPSVVALRQDRDPARCVRRAPVPPPAETPVAGGFRPTVLHTLPFDAG